jgi:hypothetical protein
MWFIILFFVGEKSGNSSAVNNISRMVAPRQFFHKSVFAVSAVKMKRAVNQYGAGNNAEHNTNPLIDARHKQDYEHNKQTQQPACEYEQILAL